MKLLATFALLFSVGFSASSQTLAVSNILTQIPKTKAACPSQTYYAVGLARYTNHSQFPSNNWFYPTTNVLSVTCDTNNDALITGVSAFGQSVCGKGSITFTDIFYPQTVWKFDLYWSNNVSPVPTNGYIAVNLNGFRTNGP